MSADATLKILAALAGPMTDDEMYADLDPALRAYLEERVESTPELRDVLAAASLVRAVRGVA